MTNVSVLRQLVSTITDPDRRATWEASVGAYVEALPKRYTRNQCAACRETASIRSGQICTDCFSDLIKAEVSREREGTTAGEALSVSNRSNWNAFKRVQNNQRIPEGAPFLLSGNDYHDRSPSTCFHDIMTRLIVICFQAFPAAGQRHTTGIVQGKNAGADRITAVAPEGFKEAILALEGFVEWNDLNAYRDGFEAGHNLLMGLADGTMTNEAFTNQTIRKAQALQKQIEEAETTGTRRPT